MKSWAIVALFVALGLMPGRLVGQVEGRQATAADKGETEVASPMLLEIPLGGDEGRKPLTDPEVTGRTFYGTKTFVCDKARVARVLVRKEALKKGRLRLVIQPTLTTEWMRQDIDLTVSLIADGKEVRKQTWDDLTIGSDTSSAAKMGAMWASSTKSPAAEFDFQEGEFEALFGSGDPPKVRIVVDIQ